MLSPLTRRDNKNNASRLQVASCVFYELEMESIHSSLTGLQADLDSGVVVVIIYWRFDRFGVVGKSISSYSDSQRQMLIVAVFFFFATLLINGSHTEKLVSKPTACL